MLILFSYHPEKWMDSRIFNNTMLTYLKQQGLGKQGGSSSWWNLCYEAWESMFNSLHPCEGGGEKRLEKYSMDSQ